MIPNKRRDAGPTGCRREEQPSEEKPIGGDVEPEKKEDDMTEEKPEGKEDERDELT